jgi:hypothetical protein
MYGLSKPTILDFQLYTQQKLLSAQFAVEGWNNKEKTPVGGEN